MDDLPPPWIALPDLDPQEPATHGLAEAYVAMNWLPFWQGLSAQDRAAYLDRWNASPEWRQVIAERYEGDGIDWADEARVAAEWRAAHVDEAPRRKWRFWR